MTKKIIRVAIVTILLLLVPFIAMQFTAEVDWTLFDFIFMGVLIFGVGLAYELVASRAGTASYRAAVAVALLAGFLLVWVNAAVGLIGSEDNPANLLYFGVLFIGIIGATAARLQPRGMSRTLFGMAILQALVPVIAFIFWRPDFSPGVVGVFTLNAFFVMMFAVSALLFRQAAVPEVK